MTPKNIRFVVLTIALGIAVGANAEDEVLSIASSAVPDSTRSLNIPEERLRDPELRAVFAQIDQAIDSLRRDTESLSAVTGTIRADLDRDRESMVAYRQVLASLEEMISDLRDDLSRFQESVLQSQSRADGQFASLVEIDADTAEELRTIKQRIGALNERLAATEEDLRLVDQSLEAQSVDVQNRFLNVSGAVEDIGLELEESYVSIASDIFLRSVIGVMFISALLLLGMFAARQMYRSGKASAEEVKTSLGRLHEEQNKLDIKLTEFLTKQMSAGSDPKTDQKFFLNVADEINRMRKRLARMPDDTKGLKPLEKALERLESGLTAEGYEIFPLLGEQYVEGLNVTPRFIPDDTLESGFQVITSVTKPQVNYRGKLVQVAEVEVSIGG